MTMFCLTTSNSNKSQRTGENTHWCLAVVRDGVVLENLQRAQMEEVGDQSEDALLARTVVAQKMAEDQAVVNQLASVEDRHLLDSI